MNSDDIDSLELEAALDDAISIDAGVLADVLGEETAQMAVGRADSVVRNDIRRFVGLMDDDDDCALVDLGPYSFIGDEIEYCPFCGADADSSDGDAFGQAACSACGESFWVEL